MPVIIRSVVTATRLSGQGIRFSVTKPGISARKITRIIEELKKASPNKNIRVVILDSRLDDFMKLRINYPQVEVELPFVDHSIHENWLLMPQNRKKYKQVTSLLDSSGDIDQVATLTRIPAEVVERIRDKMVTS